MHQNSSVSRRRAVALVTGTFAAVAAPAASRAAGTTHDGITAYASEAAGLSNSRRRMLQLLKDVRRARGAVPRAQAFRRFAEASRLNDVAELSRAATARVATRSPHTPAAAALYRQREPEGVLVDVIVRELEGSPPTDGAWMTRFADLEAAIHARDLRA